jgi:hypothetical protein
MPTPLLKSLSKKTGKSIRHVESLWDQAKKSAEKEGIKSTSKKYYPYVVGTLKKMLGVSESKISNLLDKYELMEGITQMALQLSPENDMLLKVFLPHDLEVKTAQELLAKGEKELSPAEYVELRNLIVGLPETGSHVMIKWLKGNRDLVSNMVLSKIQGEKVTSDELLKDVK